MSKRIEIKWSFVIPSMFIIGCMPSNFFLSTNSSQYSFHSCHLCMCVPPHSAQEFDYEHVLRHHYYTYTYDILDRYSNLSLCIFYVVYMIWLLRVSSIRVRGSETGSNIISRKQMMYTPKQSIQMCKSVSDWLFPKRM